MIKLDIYSDPICPWCYIGKSYLDRALEKTVDHPFNIQWHPFQSVSYTHLRAHET